MVRRTDRPAMTIAVDLERKATKQTNKPAEVGGVENAKSKYFSKSELFWYQNVSHVLTKKMSNHT